MFEYECDIYREWGYMDPSDWNDLADRCVECGADRFVLEEGTLLDVELLVQGACPEEIPVFLAIPKATTEWTSTYMVHAWPRYEDTPQVVWDMVDAMNDYPNEEEFRQVMDNYRKDVLENY